MVYFPDSFAEYIAHTYSNVYVDRTPAIHANMQEINARLDLLNIIPHTYNVYLNALAC